MYSLEPDEAARQGSEPGWGFSCTCGAKGRGYADEDGADAAAEFHCWLAEHPELHDLAEGEFLSRLQYGRGSKLWKYWVYGKGTARWMGAANPWTTLRAALLKEGVPPGQVNGLTTNIMQATPAGRALFKAHHDAGKSAA